MCSCMLYSLVGKPVGVGGMHMLSTANYEARKFGVRAAMPGFIAKKLLNSFTGRFSLTDLHSCPDLILVPVRFPAYRAASAVVKSILAQYDPNFEFADENVTDLSHAVFQSNEPRRSVHGHNRVP